MSWNEVVDGMEFYDREVDEFRTEERFVKIAKGLFDSGLRAVGYGGMRVTFMSRNGRHVYKVPKNAAGLESNESEAKRSREGWPQLRKLFEDFGPEKLARCRMAPSGVLVVEKVDVHGFVDRRQNKWVSAIDANQVGVGRGGMPVAYDYGQP